jgi:gamma-glutamyltranspeptidase/glutathione hydrolase
MRPRWPSVLIIALLVAPGLADDPPWLARGTGGMVASDSPEASRIGAATLEAGGNAFDAAVATSFALGVARPHSTGLGGGGFMVAYLADRDRFVALDFRETAPGDATPERYQRLFADRNDGPSPSVYGGNAIGTPGLLAGLEEIATRFGTRPLADLIEPAAKLAEEGFAADENHCDAVKSALKNFEKWPDLKRRHAAIYKTLLNNGTSPAVGDKIKRPALARALRTIATNGIGSFYYGEIAFAITRAVRSNDGSLDAADLRAYRTRERNPIYIPYGEYEIVSMPPPSSGGVCLAEILNILNYCSERSDLHPERDRHHVLIEAMKHAFADRARYLGDPDFDRLNVDRLLDRTYAGELAWRINPRKTAILPDYGLTPPDDRGTSHFCVVDKAGNVVALTETINGTFGSLVVAEPYGIILNNQMDDFLTVPGEPNLYGLVQNTPNLVGPGKRPLSSMSPTIVMKDNKPVLVLGASGGPRIISSVLQVLLNVIDRDMPLDKAISEIRVHHQWKPNEVFFDRQPSPELARDLRQRGHEISQKTRGAVVQAIQIVNQPTLIGASDPRKGGRPAGTP